MGVLNSCEKLLIKSFRKISVLSNSLAMWLKLRWVRRIRSRVCRFRQPDLEIPPARFSPSRG